MACLPLVIGVPKGGLCFPCPQTFASIHLRLKLIEFCSLCTVNFCCLSSVLLHALLHLCNCSDLTFLIDSKHESRRDDNRMNSRTKRSRRAAAGSDRTLATNIGAIAPDARATASSANAHCRARKAEDAESRFCEGQPEKAGGRRKEAPQETGRTVQSCPSQRHADPDRGASDCAVPRLPPEVRRDQSGPSPRSD